VNEAIGRRLSLSFEPLSIVAENVTSFPALECLRAFEPTDFEEVRASCPDFSSSLDVMLTAEKMVSVFSPRGIANSVAKAQRVNVLETDP
jgi:hypothetical protein